jgi:hypothetical protein
LPDDALILVHAGRERNSLAAIVEVGREHAHHAIAGIDRDILHRVAGIAIA